MTLLLFGDPLLALALASTPAPEPPVPQAESAVNELPAVVVTSAPAPPPRQAAISGFHLEPWQQSPVSVSMMTHAQMQALGLRSTTDAVKYDASVQNAYNAVGLSDRLAIRGFDLNDSGNYRKDGLVIFGFAPIPLENKERLEILKGLAGLQAGIAASGGVLNYITKRPPEMPLRSLTVDVSERGTTYAALDLGGLSTNGHLGYRINAAASDIHSYVPGSNGERQFLSAAFDWHVSARALWQVDIDWQHKSQLSVPGFQLLGGTTIPTGISAKTMLNNQTWSQPVVNDTRNLGARFQYQWNADWRMEVAANHFLLRRDDAVALPFDFQSNGDYTVVDSRNEHSRFSFLATQALVQGKFSIGRIQHSLSLGISTLERRDRFADYLFDPKGISNIWRPVKLPDTRAPTYPVMLRRTDDERAAFIQDVICLHETLKLHAGMRHLHLTRDQFNAAGQHIARTDHPFRVSNAALVYSPHPQLSVYVSYAQGLEPGGVAGADASNQGEAITPSKSRQTEIGVKTDVGEGFNMSAAIFEITRPFEFVAEPFVSAYETIGHERRRGLEISTQGLLGHDLSAGASVSVLWADVGGDSRVSDKRIGNIPKYKAVVYADYTFPARPNLGIHTSWQYASSKLFAPNGEIKARVAGYHVVNAGAHYKHSRNGRATTFRLGISNLFNTFYWGDTSDVLGGYLIPGAPRTVRISAQFDF